MKRRSVNMNIPRRRRALLPLLLVCLSGLGTFTGQAQTAGTTRRTGESQPITTAPVKVRLWSEKAKMDVVLVGRTATHLLQAPDASGNNPRLEIAQILGAEFTLDYNRFEVMRALYASDWATAIRLQFKACEPTFAYLDLPNNNAAVEVMELGTTMLRAAARSMRGAKSTEDRDRAKRQYESALAIFQHCAKVNWSSIGLLGTLKGCRCLIAMDNARSAYYQINSMEEPVAGDAAFGHYWLVQAELHALTNGYQSAMDASVKSLCFENKDVETFPDALLISAHCYEALGEPYRARDVYFEVAKLFPRTDWAATAAERLRKIMASGATRVAESESVEQAFLGISEDMNALVDGYLKEQAGALAEQDLEQESAVVDRMAPAPN
jgi:hypothetical protein